MKLENSIIIGASIIAATLLIVVGMNLFSSENIEQGLAAQEQAKAELPGYLEESREASRAAISAPAQDTISFAGDAEGNKTRLLSVMGETTKSVAPDRAEITLSVQTLDRSAQKSQSDNAEITQKVMDALLNTGIGADDMKTVSYSLNEQYEWNESRRKSEVVGYRTTNSILVTVKNLDSTGSVIDAAVQAGANSVSSVRFTLSKERQSSLRTEALMEAAQNAREKAQSIATGLGVSLSQVHSASENSGYSYPVYYKSLDYAEAGAEDSRATTPVTPGNIEFSASVSVQFEIR